MASALSGEAVVKGRSFFAGRIGEMVAAPASRWSTTRPTRGPTAPTPHDGEGLACRRNVLIADGVLRMFVYDTVSARRAGYRRRPGSAVRGGFAGTPSAGCRALVLSPGDEGTQDEILAAVGDGLYVQSVTGVHSGVNPVSGDFSVGAEGLMIRGGVLGRTGAGGHGGLHAAAHAARRSSRSAATCGGSPAWRRDRPSPSPTWPSAGD